MTLLLLTQLLWTSLESHHDVEMSSVTLPIECYLQVMLFIRRWETPLLFSKFRERFPQLLLNNSEKVYSVIPQSSVAVSVSPDMHLAAAIQQALRRPVAIITVSTYHTIYKHKLDNFCWPQYISTLCLDACLFTWGHLKGCAASLCVWERGRVTLTQSQTDSGAAGGENILGLSCMREESTLMWMQLWATWASCCVHGALAKTWNNNICAIIFLSLICNLKLIKLSHW